MNYGAMFYFDPINFSPFYQIKDGFDVVAVTNCSNLFCVCRSDGSKYVMYSGQE